MAKGANEPGEPRLRGVERLPIVLGEPRFRARIALGKGRRANLGVYPSPWLAALAYNLAVEALPGQRRPPNTIPVEHQADAAEVRRIAARVRDRLGLELAGEPLRRLWLDPDRLLAMVEIVLVGFWRDQAAAQGAQSPVDLHRSAERLVESTRLLLDGRGGELPTATEALSLALAARLDRAFRRAEITRAVLDDEGDDPERLAFWLVVPDVWPGGGFRAAIARVYGDGTDVETADASVSWAHILGLRPPFSGAQVRAAYRAKSKGAHPDVGGQSADFVRLRAAYEAARAFCEERGL